MDTRAFVGAYLAKLAALPARDKFRLARFPELAKLLSDSLSGQGAIHIIRI
jgi:hypothetical protein